MYYLSFSVWFISLNMTDYKFIHVAINGMISFLCVCVCVCVCGVCVYHSFFIHSSIDGHLGCLQDLHFYNIFLSTV